MDTRDRLELLLFGSDAIPMQEKRGQQALVASTHLPINMQGTPPAWLKLGEKVDALFREATLPEGWKKVATSHDMWSEIVDARGCARAGVFYKAAFYDKSAHMHFRRRYVATTDYPKDRSKRNFRVEDHGQGPKAVVLYEHVATVNDNCKTDAEKDAYFETLRQGEALAKAWLEERYPSHADTNAYWDDTAPTAEETQLKADWATAEQVTTKSSEPG